MTHLYKEDYMILNLIRYEWPQKLRSLTANYVLWYARKLEIGDIICTCRDFPDVPLIESRGCINYNPSLALRQLGYPLQDKPPDEQLQQMIIHNMGKNDQELLNRIIWAWNKVIKGKLKGRMRWRNKPILDGFWIWYKLLSYHLT